jgi:hypothetical protein
VLTASIKKTKNHYKWRIPSDRTESDVARDEWEARGDARDGSDFDLIVKVKRCDSAVRDDVQAVDVEMILLRLSPHGIRNQFVAFVKISWT